MEIIVGLEHHIILPGTILGNNCIVAAGSVVNGEFKDNSLIGGNPEIYKINQMNYISLLNKDLHLDNSINFNDKFIYLNRECNLKHWNSYFDNENKVQLMILGRPVIEASDWVSYEKFEENFVTKFLIKKYIDLEINEFCNQLNGAFSILVIDYKIINYQ